MKILQSTHNCSTCIYRKLLFNSLTDDELKLINSHKQEVRYEVGEVIRQQGKTIDDFMYLKKGLVKLFRQDDISRDQIISISKPGDFISLLSIFSNSTYKYSISALEETIVCAVSIDDFKQVLAQNEKFSMDVLNKMSTIYDEIIETKFNITKKHLRGRIAYILTYFASHIYHRNDFELPISRREIAELIEMTTENVIRILSEFKKDGIIEIEGKRIVIVNADRLEQICKLG